MMATTIKQIESDPDDYPPIGGTGGTYGLSNVRVLWQRVEEYIAYRWAPRDVTWIVEGPGEWLPPLSPASVNGSILVWSKGAEAWEAVELSPSPLGGYYLPCTGPYKFEAVVGTLDTAVPTNVQEALSRLGAYMAANPGKPGASFESVTAGTLATSHRRSASWMAEALQNSGAADLLRGYRRV